MAPSSWSLRFAAIAWFTLALPAYAEPVSLRLEDARARARERALDARLARSEAVQARARTEGVGRILRANPRIQADLRPPVTGGTMHDMGYAAQGEVLLDVAGTTGARADELRAEAALLETTADARAFDAELAACRAYAAAAVASERVQSADALMRAAETLLFAAKTRRNAGAAGDIDVSVAEGEFAETKARHAAALRERDTSVMALRTLLDLAARDEISLSTPVSAVPAAPSVAESLQRAASSRPELKQALRRQQWLKSSEDRLGRELWPGFGIYGGVDAAPVSPIFGFVGLSLELPLVMRNRGARLAVSKALQAEQERTEFELRQLERDVLAAHNAYDKRVEELRLLKDEALPTAKRTRELVDAGWRAGRLDIFRVVTAARSVSLAEQAYADALEALWRERTVLARQIGAWP